MAIQRINLGTAPSGTGGDTNRSAFKKIDDNFTDTPNAASRQVGTAAGNVMEVGVFGLGKLTLTKNYGDLRSDDLTDASKLFNKGISFGLANSDQVGLSGAFANCLIFGGVEANGAQPSMLLLQNKEIYLRSVNAGLDRVWLAPIRFYSTANTTVDANGVIKAASPIVRLFVDKIEQNDEAKLQPITLEKLGVGDYLVKGSLGFAQEGWYIEMPKDANGNVLVAVVYEQLDNNDISVKTYAKKFDEETGDVVANTAKPRDIPATRWIDLRLQALPQSDIKPFANEETTVATNAE